MENPEKLNSLLTGIISGLLLPAIVFIAVYLITSRGVSFESYLRKINEGNIVTHFISLCVFPNLFLFLLYTRLDKLKSSRGMLGITIIWAFVVFIMKAF